jgi:hypothetical protein
VVSVLALAVALTGDLAVGRRGRRAAGELARARARLVEVLDGRLEIATYNAGPRALAELGERFRATYAPRRRWSAREGQACSAPTWPPPAPWPRCWPTAPDWASAGCPLRTWPLPCC